MKHLTIMFALVFLSNSTFATYSRPVPAAQASAESNGAELRTNLGFIVNQETREIYCKFSRKQSPNSFPTYTQAFVGNSSDVGDAQTDGYSSIRNCTEAELEYSESFARQSVNQELKVAALPVAAGVLVCTAAFLDGAAFALTIGREDVSNLDTFNQMGIEGFLWGLYQTNMASSTTNALIVAGLKSIVKLNFACMGLGAGAGGAARGIWYLINR